MNNAVTVTIAAQEYINNRLTGDELLLVKVNNKGCSGHSIEYSTTNSTTVGKLDEVITWPGGGLVIHSTSVMGLLGSILDVTESILEKYLVWENPNAQNRCGCGTSFELKPCESSS